MENGLQTHSVSDVQSRRALLAGRMNFMGESGLKDFDNSLEVHTSHVRAAYDRIFGRRQVTDNGGTTDDPVGTHVSVRVGLTEQPDAEHAAQHAAASVFAKLMNPKPSPQAIEDIAKGLGEFAAASLNPHRALKLISLIASSLDKSSVKVAITAHRLKSLARLCGTSEFFGEMIAGHPGLIADISDNDTAFSDCRGRLLESIEMESNFRSKLIALRREWARLLIKIGTLDASDLISIGDANLRQTELATSALDAGFRIALHEVARRYGNLNAEARFAVLGIGRLGSSGMDYGSDLDMVMIYDDAGPSLVDALDKGESFGRLSELLVTAISSLTRDGSLYRVDLRLRPDGKSGPTCTPARAFLTYLDERAQPWEWLAYVKLRAVAGDMSFGMEVEKKARDIIHRAARRIDDVTMRSEVRRIRDRLEREKSGSRRGSGLDIKFGRGGMLDVYFAARYLQLRDDVPDVGEDRSTSNTLVRLHENYSLSEEDFRALDKGYALLRALDHNLRLIIGRSTRLPAMEHPALADIAQRMKYDTADALVTDLTTQMENIRAAYDRVVK
jgi:glutamate-ammonia-ligase adenylyltransferase